MLKGVWDKWKEIAERIGNFQAQVVFSILYFVLITPVGIIVRILKDYLRIKNFPQWERYELNCNSMRKLKEQ